MTHDNPTEPNSEKQSPWRLRGVRLAAIILGLLLWQLTQSMIGQRAEVQSATENAIVDQAHVLTAAWNRALNENKTTANWLLIISTGLIDLVGIWLLVLSIGGKTIRPFVALFILFTARQISQYFCALPLPEGIIWRDPGVPSLLITYGVANDFFFSGHTGIAVLGALEFARRYGRIGIMAGMLLCVFEVITVLVLRAHYTMDVIAGAAIAILAALAASRLADSCDRSLNRLAGSH